MTRPAWTRFDPKNLDPEPFLDPGTGFRGWTLTLPQHRALSTPAFDGERILLGAGYGTYEFRAFDARTGRAAWLGRTGDDGPTAGLVAEGYVAFNTESCTVCVLRADTGSLVWERWLGDPLLAQPAAADGRLFMAWPAGGRHRLGAFGLASGRALWETEIGADVITAPVVDDGDVYVSTYDGNVSRFDAASGKEMVRRDLGATSAPWIWQGEVFVAHREPGERHHPHPRERTSGFSGKRRRAMHEAKQADYLVSKRGTRRHAQDLFLDSSVGFGHAPEAAKLEQVERLVGRSTVYGAWSFQGSRPCVCQGRLYTIAGDVLTATEVDGEKEVWRWEPEIGGDPDDRTLSPPAAIPGRVYASGRDGRIYSWDAVTGALRWAVPVGAPALFQPAVMNGWVFAGLESGRLVAFETGDPGDHGWPMWGGGPGHNG